MPSLSSSIATVGEEPDSMALRSIREVGRSVIRLSLLPLAALQPEPGNHDRGKQEWDHRARDRGTFAELACDDGALIRQRRHQMRGIDRTAPRHRPDQLEVGECEQPRERRHYRKD